MEHYDCLKFLLVKHVFNHHQGKIFGCCCQRCWHCLCVIIEEEAGGLFGKRCQEMLPDVPALWFGGYQGVSGDCDVLPLCDMREVRMLPIGGQAFHVNLNG